MKKFLLIFGFIIIAFIGLNVYSVNAESITDYTYNQIDYTNCAHVAGLARAYIKANTNLIQTCNGSNISNFDNDTIFNYCYAVYGYNNNLGAAAFYFSDMPASVNYYNGSLSMSNNKPVLYLQSKFVVVFIPYHNPNNNVDYNNYEIFFGDLNARGWSDGIGINNTQIKKYNMGAIVNDFNGSSRYYPSSSMSLSFCGNDIYDNNGIVYARNMNYNYSSYSNASAVYNLHISNINTYSIRITPYNIGTPYSLHALISYYTANKPDEDWLLEEDCQSIVTTGHHVDMDVKSIDYVFSWSRWFIH